MPLISEETSLIYIVSYRTDRATQRDSVSKITTNKQTKSKLLCFFGSYVLKLPRSPNHSDFSIDNSQYAYPTRWNYNLIEHYHANPTSFAILEDSTHRFHLQPRVWDYTRA